MATARSALVRSNTVADEPPRLPRRRRPQVTEDRILTVAERLFAQHGFDAVSTKQLARESGLTIGALYHHFASKEALYETAVRRVFARRSVVPKTLFDKEIPARQRLTQLVAWFVGSLVSDENFSLLLRRELLDPRPGPESPAYVEFFQHGVALFKDLLRQLVPNADVDQAVASVVALSFGLASMKGIYAIVPGIRKTFRNPQQIADHAVQLLLGGIRT